MRTTAATELVLFVNTLQKQIDTHKAAAEDGYTFVVSGHYVWLDENGLVVEQRKNAGDKLSFCPTFVARINEFRPFGN